MTDFVASTILTTMVVNIVDRLREIGLTEYEARAYVALLHSNPVTAYEAAKSAGIPTSKIYQVMARLIEKGTAIEVRDQTRRKYVPMDPDELINQYRSAFESNMENLEQDLKSFGESAEISYIWNFTHYDEFMRHVSRSIESARKFILLSAWEEELSRFCPLLEHKEKEKIRIAVVDFGETACTAGQHFIHPIEDTIYAEKGGRGFTLVIDSKQAIVATIYSDSRLEGAWSKNAGFVTLAEDYIKHDIYIMKIVHRFDTQLVDVFGNKYQKLRDIFSDKEVKR